MAGGKLAVFVVGSAFGGRDKLQCIQAYEIKGPNLIFPPVSLVICYVSISCIEGRATGLH
jgi:hypothetical protein